MTFIKKGLPLFAVFILLIAPVSCTSKGDRAAGSAGDSLEQGTGGAGTKILPQKKPATTAARQLQADRIRAVTLYPENILVSTGLTVNAEVFPPLDKDGNESLKYFFWINGEVFAEQETASLAPFSYKKGDSLFVDVVLVKDGEEAGQKRSELLFVLNSKPEIKEVQFPQIKGTGTYKIPVSAVDADGDPLTFSLEADEGIPAGLRIDAGSGLISYNLEQPPDRDLKFRVVAKDGEQGGEDWQELFIRFTRATVKEETKTGKGEEK
jgi:hypothetical protein